MYPFAGTSSTAKKFVCDRLPARLYGRMGGYGVSMLTSFAAEGTSTI